MARWQAAVQGKNQQANDFDGSVTDGFFFVKPFSILSFKKLSVVFDLSPVWPNAREPFLNQSRATGFWSARSVKEHFRNFGFISYFHCTFLHPA